MDCFSSRRFDRRIVSSNAAELKLEILTTSANAVQNPAQHKGIAEEALRLLEQVVSDDNLPLAGQLVRLALDEARKTNEKELITQAEVRVAEVAEKFKSYEAAKIARATLEKTPRDPHANLVVGKYQCFIQDDWDDGLRTLALGDDESLKALAKQELAGAATSPEQAKLGDGWWSLAEHQEGTPRKDYRARAGYWYQQALPGLSGLMKDKIEKRLTMGGSPSSPVVLRYDWREDQLADWKWEGIGKPTVKTVDSNFGMEVSVLATNRYPCYRYFD